MTTLRTVILFLFLLHYSVTSIIYYWLDGRRTNFLCIIAINNVDTTLTDRSIDNICWRSNSAFNTPYCNSINISSCSCCYYCWSWCWMLFGNTFTSVLANILQCFAIYIIEYNTLVSFRNSAWSIDWLIFFIRQILILCWYWVRVVVQLK